MATSLWVGLAEEEDGAEVPLELAVFTADRPHHRSGETVAWPERDLPQGGTFKDYLTARKQGARSFTLWRHRDRGEVVARLVTRTASAERGAEYEVHGGDDVPLAVLRRTPASWLGLRRARWSMSRADAPDAPAAVGVQGSTFWWWIWLLSYPVQVLLAVVSLGTFNGVGSPRRTRFRDGDDVVLDYRGMNRGLRVLAEGWDPAVTATVVVLMDSFGSRLTERNKCTSYV